LCRASVWAVFTSKPSSIPRLTWVVRRLWKSALPWKFFLVYLAALIGDTGEEIPLHF
jgi:hypothetical protein